MLAKIILIVLGVLPLALFHLFIYALVKAAANADECFGTRDE